MNPDLTAITWQSLTSITVLSAVLIAAIEVAKRVKLVCGPRSIFAFGFILAELLAQVAFWRVGEQWSEKTVSDAALVGFLATLIAVGGHTIARKIIEGNGKPDAAQPP